MMEKAQQVFQADFKQIKAKVQKDRDRTDFDVGKIQGKDQTLYSGRARLHARPWLPPQDSMSLEVQCPISSEPAK